MTAKVIFRVWTAERDSTGNWVVREWGLNVTREKAEERAAGLSERRGRYAWVEEAWLDP